MDYEKKYNEALERARKIHDEIVNNEVIGFPEQITDIFPELRESKDERVIKTLYHLVIDHDWLNGATKEEVLTWLEKQKEYHIPWYDYQKSKEAGYTIVPNEEYDRLTKPAEWSDEDERNRDRAIFYTGFYQLNQGTTKGSEECIDWLKSLRPQPKQEWSEEDELCFDSFSALMSLLDDDIPEKEPVIKWVKQLKNRFSNSDPRSVGLHYILKSKPHWKPSKEQIQALEYVVSSIPPNYLKEQEYMTTLIGQVIQQLKKL